MIDKSNLMKYRELRRRQVESGLDPSDEQDLDRLVSMIEDAEAADLRSSIERIRHERQQLQDRNRNLAQLLDRKKALAEHLRATLVQAEAERESINDEVARIVAESGAHSAISG